MGGFHLLGEIPLDKGSLGLRCCWNSASGTPLLQFRQIQLYHIAVQRHFPQIGFPVDGSKLGHFLLNQGQLLRGNPEIHLYLPFPLCRAHRSGSRFLGAAGLRSGCQRQFEIVRKRRRNFVVFRRGGNKTKRFLAQKECSRFAVSGA